VAQKGRRAEADARMLDNESPATTYLSVTVRPRAVTGSPRGTGEVRAARAGLLHELKFPLPILFTNNVQKKAFDLKGDCLGPKT
jgi:hypothetical protein